MNTGQEVATRRIHIFISALAVAISVLAIAFSVGAGLLFAQTNPEPCTDCGGGGGGSCTPPLVTEWGAPYESSCEACKDFCDELSNSSLRIQCILNCDGQVACTDPHQIPTRYCVEPDDPTPPPPSCSPGPGEVRSCEQNGGAWNSSDCSCTEAEDGAATIIVKKEGTGTGTVTSGSGGGIDCGGDCSESKSTGVHWTWVLEADADADSTFNSWSGVPNSYRECTGALWWRTCTDHSTCGTSASCRVLVAEDDSTTVTATFTSDAPDVPPNNLPSLTISGPNEGVTGELLSFGFRGIDPDGDRLRYQISWDNNTSVEEMLPPNREVCWFPGICFNVAQFVNSGTTRSSSHSFASSQRFRARAQDHHGAYSPWVTKLVTIGEGEPEPDPEPIKYRLSVLALPSGSGSATGADMYDEGTVVTSVATAESGYAFLSWSSCDSVSGNSCTVTMNSARTITAQFEQTLKPVVITRGETWVPQGGSTTITLEGGSDDAVCELFGNGSFVQGNLSTPSSTGVGPIEEVTEYEVVCSDGVNTVTSEGVYIYVLPKYGEF